ncbi:MAG: hypothetical protein GDA54_03800 [Alphaproteobacteria bacterium GM7ARS4]|nr:hypothetical protein [Alphaproteobacteria bacterium GM7ARS4]
MTSHEPFTILYQDDDVIVVHKEAGIATHGDERATPNPHAPSSRCRHRQEHLSSLLHAHFSYRLPTEETRLERHGIVHRLDKGSSGLLVVARSMLALKALKKDFAHHHVLRYYHAIVYGVPSAMAARLNEPLGQDRHDFRRRCVDRAHGKPAITDYRVLRVLGKESLAASLVLLRLHTGRTHQIRVHMAHHHHPLWSDPLYAYPMPQAGTRRGRRQGVSRYHAEALRKLNKRFPYQFKALQEEEKKRAKNPASATVLPQITPRMQLGRQALHACVLGFHHPVDGRFLRFHAPMPEDMRHLLRFFTRLETIR